MSTDTVNTDAASGGVNDQPDRYYEVKHWKSFAKKAANGAAVLAVGAVLIVATAIASVTVEPGGLVTGAGVITGIIVGSVGAFLVYRRYWQWQNSPIEGNVHDGMLLEYHAESRLLFLRGSAPDQYEFNAYALVTPRRTWPELWFFRRVQTLHLKSSEAAEPVVIRDVVDVDRLLAIDAYWSSLDRAELQNEKSQLQVQREILSGIDELNEQFRQFFAYITGKAPLKESPEPVTQELPAVNDTEDPDS